MFETLGHWMNYVLKIKDHEQMECDFNLSCYGLFKISETIIILKVFLSI
jgi:hypothetical protein